jgi:hypothetical protein
MSDEPAGLVSIPRPIAIPEITQDAVNAAIRRYASPEFHAEVYAVQHPITGVVHPVIALPGTLTEPVMSKRDCQGVIDQARCYIRKPGPRSEEPRTPDEWRSMLNRCVRAGRDDMLEAIRSIVSGRVEPREVPPSALEALRAFCDAARERWHALVADEPPDAPSRFPSGYHEMGFSLIGATPANGLIDLQHRLDVARRVKLTGWTPFLAMNTAGWEPYARGDFVEAWIGRTVSGRSRRTASRSDFWRASPAGQLYTIRGYPEDDQIRPPDSVLDITEPVRRLGEGAMFATRLSETFADVEAIAIRARYTGLEGRTLVSLQGEWWHLIPNEISRTDEVVLETQVTPSQLRDNLAEVLHQLLIPLYERFAFFRLPIILVEHEIEKMAMRRL